MPKHHPSRRAFLKGAATAAAALAAPRVVPSAALGAEGQMPPSDRVNVGFVGLGGHGTGHNLNGFLSKRDGRIAALCDCDAACLSRAHQMAVNSLNGQGRSAEASAIFLTPDWRRVIERPDVDAVMVSAPDHWHCLMSVMAIQAGKDVICEKPMYNIAEGRALADTVKRYAAVFQTSTEDRSIGIYHRLAEIVRNGWLGKLQRIIVTLPEAPGSPGAPTPQPVLINDVLGSPGVHAVAVVTPKSLAAAAASIVRVSFTSVRKPSLPVITSGQPRASRSSVARAVVR